MKFFVLFLISIGKSPIIGALFDHLWWRIVRYGGYQKAGSAQSESDRKNGDAPVSKGQKESVKTWIFAPTELISLPPKHAYIYSSFPRTIDFLKDTDIIKLTIKTETRVRTLVPQDSPVGQFPSAIFL